MIRKKKAAALATLVVIVALAVPSASQSPSREPTRDKRLESWEKQLVLPQRISSRLSWAERRLQPSGLRKLKQIARALAPDIAAGTEFPALCDKAGREVATAFPGLSDMDVTEAAFIVMSLATEDMDDDIRMIMAEIKATNAAKQRMRDMIKDLNRWISEEMSKHPGSEDLDNEKVSGSKPASRAARPAARTPPLPIRRVTPETKTSPVIHFEYAKAPVVTPLPPRNPGLSVSGLKALQDDIKGNLDGLNELSEMTSMRLQMTMDRRAKFIQTLSNMMKKIATTQESLVQNLK
jgi:Spy/CpxP family protein refolding chaperone